jgi:hypothetical protein
MAQTANEIAQRIETERDRLGRNLNELETRVHSATDWRTYYHQHPYWFVGAAFGGGLLLSGALSGSRHGRSEYARSRETTEPRSDSSSQALEHEKNGVWASVDQIQDALIAFGTAKVKDVLSELLPGLREHLSETGERRS